MQHSSNEKLSPEQQEKVKAKIDKKILEQKMAQKEKMITDGKIVNK